MARSAKGSAFERSICRQLSLWWSEGQDDNLFWRTSQSGGRATTRAKAGKRADKHCGDICALDHVGAPLLRVISWELKRGYGKATIHDLLDRPTKAKQQVYEEWIAKADRDRRRAGALYWAIIHQRDRREPIMFFPGRLWVALSEARCLLVHKGPFLSLNMGVDYIEGVRLQTFLECVTPQHIMCILTANEKGETA